MAPDLDCMSPALLMEGYLRKSKKWSKRYFVLREGPPPCLEYYDSAKRKAGKRRRVIDLKNAWNIDKKVSLKHKHLIGIYTETDYFAMGAENDAEQETWVNALQKAVLRSQGHLMYRHIWQGTIETKDLDCNHTTKMNLQGLHRCCLTDKTMVFVRMNGANSCSLQDPVEIAIGSIRSCGHKDNFFFMEPGRSSGIGTGKLWMELEDSAVADCMHRTILAYFGNLGQDDSRQRSCSFGSGTSRAASTRSRHYYNPPPSQVGLGKSANVYHSNSKPSAAAYAMSRNRCESFPTSQATSLVRESWYRTSSEGETTMKCRYPLHTLAYRRKAGAASPIARVYSKSKQHPLLLQSPFRTPSPSGSFTSSSNSSMEHINAAHDHTLNGQSSAAKEGRAPSDEYLPSGYILSQTQLRHSLLSYGMEMAPPPPSIPPETTPVLSTALDSDYACMHPRCHSIDDNFSCSTGPSSLSSSPRIPPCLLGPFPSTDTGYFHSRTSSQSSSHSHVTDTGHSTPRVHCSAESYPHELPANEQLSADYTPMAPGRGVGTSTPTQDNSGYVPMRPLVRSLPQDILFARRRSLSDNRFVNGSFCSSSSEKNSGKRCSKCKCDTPHSYPFHCVITTSNQSVKDDAKQGFGLERQNQPLKSLGHDDTPLPNYSEEYAIMNGLPRMMGNVQLGEISGEANDAKSLPPSEKEVYHEYLPMSPMSAANSKKSVVGNVLSIAKSVVKSAAPSPANEAPKYPHQQTMNGPSQCITNSLDRRTKEPRWSTKSFGINILSGQRQAPRASKHGRKISLRVNADLAKSTPLTTDSFSSPAPPLSPPGGEYVSIDFNKAKKQIGPEYVTLTGPSFDPSSPLERLGSPSGNQNSNRNMFSPTQSPSKDNYTLLKACN